MAVPRRFVEEGVGRKFKAAHCRASIIDNFYQNSAHYVSKLLHEYYLLQAFSLKLITIYSTNQCFFFLCLLYCSI